jgi:hypothetical protein
MVYFNTGEARRLGHSGDPMDDYDDQFEGDDDADIIAYNRPSTAVEFKAVIDGMHDGFVKGGWHVYAQEALLDTMLDAIW